MRYNSGPQQLLSQVLPGNKPIYYPENLHFNVPDTARVQDSLVFTCVAADVKGDSTTNVLHAIVNESAAPSIILEPAIISAYPGDSAKFKLVLKHFDRVTNYSVFLNTNAKYTLNQTSTATDSSTYNVSVVIPANEKPGRYLEIDFRAATPGPGYGNIVAKLNTFIGVL